MLVTMTDHTPADHLTITAPHELAYPAADDFSAHLTGLPPDGELTVDLRNVDFMDSSGLRALLIERTRRQRAGGSIVVSNPTPLVQRLFSVTGLDGVLRVR
jgi:anti-sigma B factor antagonist